MQLHIIAAMTTARVIGKNGKLPWHLPEDMKLFKELTTENTVIMGKNTWNSIPEKFRPLPNRTNIIVSSTLAPQKGTIVCENIPKAIIEAKKIGKDAYFIGGAGIYKEALELADVLHISWVKENYLGDTYFPEINFSEWKEVLSTEKTGFTYKKYERKNKLSN
ncbi:MAG: dihydrofolate reductase [archaeon]